MITSEEAELLLSRVRDVETEATALRDALYTLGELAALRIAREWLSRDADIRTPMRRLHPGRVLEATRICVVSTSDDYAHFGAGVASLFPGCLRGQLNLGGARGAEALRSPVVSYSLPRRGAHLDAVIVAKSVLGTGCTALRLLAAAREAYAAKTMIAVSVFHSKTGIEELVTAEPHTEIVVFGASDELDENGMLVPGIGNIDTRTSSKHSPWRERVLRGLAKALGAEVRLVRGGKKSA